MSDEPFEIRLIRSAQHDLDRLPDQIRERVMAKLKKLAANPYSRQAQMLSAREDSYKARVGDYRILFEIELREHAIWVTRIAHRREVYR
jgi:mRNA interferase RelE/StbE